jgi:hypothetical protein
MKCILAVEWHPQLTDPGLSSLGSNTLLSYFLPFIVSCHLLWGTFGITIHHIFRPVSDAVAFAWASIEPALTVATIFHTNYGFNTAQNGLVLGISLMLGAFIGELFGGHVLDT